jgi:hypothetical protein
LRERWFGSTGKRVPELAIEGDPLVPLAEALVLDDVSDDAKLREAHTAGTPVVVRAGSAEQIVAALKRPEVASVLVPEDRPELLKLDLRELTYG